MYIRFVSPYWSGQCRSHLGFFHAFHDARRLCGADDWHARELNRVSAWFNAHLAVPRCLSRRMGHHGPRRGVCWFRDTATDHVSLARYACWLMEDVGVPIREIRARRPGARIWEDDHQIVAVPDRGQRH